MTDDVPLEVVEPTVRWVGPPEAASVPRDAAREQPDREPDAGAGGDAR